MMSKKLLWSVFVLLLLVGQSIQADEGMWIPLLLGQTKYADMQSKGLELTPSDIYDINHSSLKDAVVQFDGGCTGVVVSDKGLLLTNHHCGYSWIQYHSTLEHDYLTDGFWAKTFDEELVNPGITVSLLDKMEDITAKVLKDITPEMTEVQRYNAIRKASTKILEDLHLDGKFHVAEVKPLFSGNQYYLYIYKVYHDVRLVGAPPSAIGKFGGDTDNWMWPRHTGDFSVFRIYADANNQPADYSPNNVPYKPLEAAKVSMAGPKVGDFTMVMGYPGSSDRFITSYELDLLVNQDYPIRIAMRDIILETWEQYMNNDPLIKIQYSSKYFSKSNAWKKWQGVIRGINKSEGINLKRESEKEYSAKTTKHKDLLSQFEKLCQLQRPYVEMDNYYLEGLLGVEWLKMAASLDKLVARLANSDKDAREKAVAKFKSDNETFFKDYVYAIDQDLFRKMMNTCYSQFSSYMPKQYTGQHNKVISRVEKKALFSDEDEFYAVLDKFAETGVSKPIYKYSDMMFYVAINQVYNNQVVPSYDKYANQLDSLSRIYVSDLLDIYAGQPFHDNANFTMRVTYGKVEGFSPEDALIYQPFTYLEGVMEKGTQDIKDYIVPAKLKALYEAKDYGPYSINGKVPVCFLGSNHTSGGNSGSPVFNGRGELIGLNFDRNWEGTMSDVLYDPSQCRNIMVDIRYILFIIDKYAQANRLIEEMNIVDYVF